MKKIYKSESFSNVDMESYINGLVTQLKNAYDKNKIEFIINTDKISLSIDIAIPCALILNEFIINAIKHAFSKGTGFIEVNSELLNKKTLRLKVRDNGEKLSEGFDIKKIKTFGLHIVDLLVKQIEGKWGFYEENSVKTFWVELGIK